MSELQTDLTVHLLGRPRGEGVPTMLFLHGLTDSGLGWPEAVAHWGEHYAIVSVDQRGHGTSPRFTPEQLEAHPGDVMVDDAVALLEQLDRPLVVGHSLGGAVALAAGVRRPELVRALVLEDPAPLGPEEAQTDVARGAEFLDGLEPSRTAPDDDELVRRRREAHPDWPESELLVTGLAEQRMDHTYLAHGDWKPSPRWPESFASVAVPTLVVTGDRADEVIVGEEMEAGIAALGNERVRVVRIGGAGHCIRRDQPTAYYRAVDEWLDAH